MSVRREAVETVGRVEVTKDPRELRENVAGLAEEIQARRQGAREAMSSAASEQLHHP